MWSFDLEMCGEGEVRERNFIHVHIHVQAGKGDEGNWHTLNKEEADVNPKDRSMALGSYPSSATHWQDRALNMSRPVSPFINGKMTHSFLLGLWGVLSGASAELGMLLKGKPLPAPRPNAGCR